jgi:periplasmic protein TonB
LFAKANQGKPPIAATPKPAVFNAPGVVGAHGASVPPPHPAMESHPAGNPAPGVGPPKPVAGQPLPGQPGGAHALTPPPAVHPNVPANVKASTPPPPPPPKPKNKPKPKTPPKENREGEHRE